VRVHDVAVIRDRAPERGGEQGLAGEPATYEPQGDGAPAPRVDGLVDAGRRAAAEQPGDPEPVEQRARGQRVDFEGTGPVDRRHDPRRDRRAAVERRGERGDVREAVVLVLLEAGPRRLRTTPAPRRTVGISSPALHASHPL
jgi:hypothetical protein